MFDCAVPFLHPTKITAGTYVCSEATYNSFSKSWQFLIWDAIKLVPPHIQTSHKKEREKIIKLTIV